MATRPDPARKAKPAPKLLTVAKAWRLTPSMIRVTLSGPEITGMAGDCAGANCKIHIPEPGETRDAFLTRFAAGPRPAMRTFTVRAIRPGDGELDIDFVDHGDSGPASAWARRAAPGAVIGFNGPGPIKVTNFDGDFWLIAADPSAIPVAAATLEAMPRSARGLAVFETPHAADRQEIDAPKGVELRWLTLPDPRRPSTAQEAALRALGRPEGRIRACVAGEHSAITGVKRYLFGELNLPREDVYISGYWKLGMVEDEHQAFKRAEAAA